MNKIYKKYLQVLKYIQYKGLSEQTKISRSLDLSLMTVNKIANGLYKNGIIMKAGKSDSKSGRKSELYKFNSDLYLSVGIDINDDRIMISAVTPEGKIISNGRYSIDPIKKSFMNDEGTIELLIESYNNFISDNKLNNSKIAVIGIAPEGIIDSENGRCVLGTHLGDLVNINLRDGIDKILNKSVFVDDPARSLPYFEKKFNPELANKNFIYIFLGKGVGSGIVINGEIYRGFKGIAGEIGHIIVDKNGSRCKCGNYGCLETIASKESIIKQVKEGIKEGVYTNLIDLCGGDVNNINLEMLRQAVENKDKFSHNLIEYVGNNLGSAIAILVNIFNPEFIIIGGEVSILGEYLVEPVKRAIKQNALHVIEETVEIKIFDYDQYKNSQSIAIEAFDMLFNYNSKKSMDFIDNLLKDISI